MQSVPDTGTNSLPQCGHGLVPINPLPQRRHALIWNESASKKTILDRTLPLVQRAHKEIIVNKIVYDFDDGETKSLVLLHSLTDAAADIHVDRINALLDKAREPVMVRHSMSLEESYAAIEATEAWRALATEFPAMTNPREIMLQRYYPEAVVVPVAEEAAYFASRTISHLGDE
jgi:hypothetical protein